MQRRGWRHARTMCVCVCVRMVSFDGCRTKILWNLHTGEQSEIEPELRLDFERGQAFLQAPGSERKCCADVFDLSSWAPAGDVVAPDGLVFWSHSQQKFLNASEVGDFLITCIRFQTSRGAFEAEVYQFPVARTSTGMVNFITLP